jgi:glutaredoxin
VTKKGAGVLLEMQVHLHAFVVVPATRYLSESRDLLPCPRSDNTFDSSSLKESATASDLVLFVKPGCGHCARAKALTADMPNRTLVELSTETSRQGLARKLRLPFITVPVVFVKGRCVGDGQALRSLLANDGSAFKDKMGLPMAQDPFAPGVSDTSAWTERHLMQPPGGPEFKNYFLNTYGNTVRAISCVHIFLFVLIALFPFSTLTKTIAILLIVDLCLFILSGNLSALSISATSLLWTRRGPVVPAIPYKAVFVFYIVELSRIYGGHASADEIRATSISAALNSTFLAVLRF